jgi:CRP-like cAMP-binding protein
VPPRRLLAEHYARLEAEQEAALRAEQEALAAACPAPAAEAMETGDGEPIFEEVAPPDPDGGGDGGDGGDEPPDEEDDDDIYNMNILIPERLVGRRVARLKKGSSFGENGLHTDGTAQRAATVVAATDRLLLLKLSRDDIQTEQDDDDHVSESDEEEEPPDMDENFEPMASSALRRMSRGSFGDNPLEAKIASLTEGMVQAEEKKEPPPGERRASTTLLGALSDACPREASIHITVERARRSTVRKPGAAGAAPKAKQSMSKKKTVIKNAQKTDKEINSK